MQQRWKAVWFEGSERREFVFDSINNRMIARIDFRLKANALRMKIPASFELEEKAG